MVHTTGTEKAAPLAGARDYVRFLRASPRLLAFGFLLAFFSSFGQTFFIGLFSADIRAAFTLSHGEFGSIYSAATLASGLSLPWLGRLVDELDLRTYTYAVTALLASACFLLAAADSLLVLGLAILGLRLGGQGLMSHVSVTSMARYFEGDRGKAVSVASMGHPGGEAALPLAAVATAGVLGWRGAWIAFGVALLVVLVPLVAWTLRGHGERHRLHLARLAAAGAGAVREWSRRHVLRDPRFWLSLPVVLASSFIVTGVFFHGAHLAGSKGWSLGWFAGSFTAYALSTVASSLAAGPLIDRFGARRVLPFYLIPLGVALAVLAGADHPLVAFAFMLTAGLSTGINFVMGAALWADLYGTTHIGAIRAMVQGLMVLSTAASPVAMGWLLDLGIGMEAIALGCLAWILAAMPVAALAMRLPEPAL